MHVPPDHGDFDLRGSGVTLTNSGDFNITTHGANCYANALGDANLNFMGAETLTALA